MKTMTAEQYRRMLQGKVNRVQGAKFEDLISDACVYYALKDQAYIEKTPEPMKPVRAVDRQRGTFEAIFEKRGQPDYKGTLAGGRAVCFEAKHTDADRITQDAVKPHQAEALDKHSTMGALCFILVSLGHRVYRVPWVRWKNMKAICGHKYMNEEDLKPYMLGEAFGIIRFLDENHREEQQE